MEFSNGFYGFMKELFTAGGGGPGDFKLSKDCKAKSWVYVEAMMKYAKK